MLLCEKTQTESQHHLPGGTTQCQLCDLYLHFFLKVYLAIHGTSNFQRTSFYLPEPSTSTSFYLPEPSTNPTSNQEPIFAMHSSLHLYLPDDFLPLRRLHLRHGPGHHTPHGTS